MAFTNVDSPQYHGWQELNAAIDANFALLEAGGAGAVKVDSLVLAPTWVAATSLTPISIAYNYDGSTTTGDTDAYGIRSTITQTGTNALTAGSRGYLMGVRSEIVTSGFTDLCYGFYSKMRVTGASTSAEIFGSIDAMYTGAATITANWVAGSMVKMDGTADVTGQASNQVGCCGYYLSWNETYDMTCLTAGVHVAVINGSKLDSGFHIDGGGSLTNAFYSRNTSGTPVIVTGLRLDGVHTNALALPAAGTAPVAATGHSTTNVTGGTVVKIAILVDTTTYYLLASTAPTGT